MFTFVRFGSNDELTNQDIRLLQAQVTEAKERKAEGLIHASNTKAERAVEAERKEKVTVDVNRLPETVENKDIRSFYFLPEQKSQFPLSEEVQLKKRRLKSPLTPKNPWNRFRSSSVL